MLTIQNAHIAISATEDGRELRLVDRARDTVWLLDEASLLYGGCIVNNEYPIKLWRTALRPLRPHSARREGNLLSVTYLAGESEVVYTYALLDDGVEIRLKPPAEDGIETLSMPGAFMPQGQQMKLLLPIMQGMLWDGRGSCFSHLSGCGNQVGFSMRMFGAMAERGGLSAACDSDADCLWLYEKDERGFRAMNIAHSSLGAIRYERVLRIYLTDPGITQIAKRYRRHVIDAGRFLSWREKLEKRPELERLFGAVMCYLGYCHDDGIDYAEEFAKLKAYGFDRALVYPVAFSCYDHGFSMGGLKPIQIPEDRVDAIKALGYDVCPWTWINETIDRRDAKSRGMFKMNRAGEPIFGWQIDDKAFYKVCTGEMYAFQLAATQRPYESRLTWDHYDVLSCATVGECYALDHAAHPGRPLSRSEDIDWIRRTLVAGYGGGKRIAVSSESFNDQFSREYDMGSYKAWPQFGPWCFWPIPLTGLVYHDSIMHTWYEQHSYNIAQWNRALDPNLFQYGGGRPELQAAADALMGTPPDIFPFGTQYTFTGNGAETTTYRIRFEDPLTQYALQKAKPIADLHRRIGMLEMVDFAILSEDGYVQRTRFSDGTEVTANFDMRPRRAGEDGLLIQGMDYVVRAHSVNK